MVPINVVGAGCFVPDPRDHGCVDRMTLAGLLDRDGAAYLACRRALLGGADFTIYRGRVDVADLVSTYRVRHEHAREVGIPTLGFAEAVDDLQSCALGEVLIGSVDQLEPAYHFAIFLDTDASKVAACIGISRP
jgi:hypothetical protein